ncbi:MAG: ribosome biogenesis/translation initiation ATPase RLI, partial [Halodesulfurarchaeum sp.]
MIHERIRDTDGSAIVIEHDLAMLDLLSDGIHLLYGEPGGFGVVSQDSRSARASISSWTGIWPRRTFRSAAMPSSSPQPAAVGPQRGPGLRVPGTTEGVLRIHIGSRPWTDLRWGSIGIIGENALGKTTFVNLLAGRIEADNGTVPGPRSVSYKSQYITPGDILPVVNDGASRTAGG